MIVSAKKYFWTDELYSFFLLADPSFQRMLAAFADKINNTPIVYFVTGWLWVRVFGASEVSLRLFSSLGICMAALLTWVVLRRAYGSWPASLASVGVFAMSVLVFEQNAEARMYGLYLALAALAMLQFDRLQRDGSCSKGSAVATACIHAALLHTHLFGIFYGGAIVATYALLDRLRGRWQVRFYVAAAAAWISLLAYLPVFLVQADAGRPRTWIPPPTIGDLTYFYTAELRFTSVVLFVLAVAALWPRGQRALTSTRRMHSPANVRDFLVAHPTLVLGCVFLMVPVGVWLASLTVKPIFSNRYMLPTLLGTAVVTAHLLAVFDEAVRAGRAGSPRPAWPGAIVASLYASRVVRAVIVGVVLAGLVVGALLFRPPGRPYLWAYDGGHAELPIVVQFSGLFLRNVHYGPQRERYVYVLDWESAVAPESGRFPPQEYKHMEALLRQYPERFTGQIVASETFLAEHGRFLVFDHRDYDYACDGGFPWHSRRRNLDRWSRSLQCPRWLEERILPDPRFQIREVAEVGGRVMLLIERTGS